MAEQFERRIVELIALAEQDARQRRENAGMNGEMGDGGEGLIREQIRFYCMGMNKQIPPEWEELYGKQLDPEYAEYERLRRKFGG